MRTFYSTARTLLVVSSMVPTFALADTADKGWFVKPMIGYSQLSDQAVSASGAAAFDGNWDINTSGGFAAGLGVGYQYNPQWSIELYWEYRSNDSDTSLTSNTGTFSGNYASNIFYLNGYYHFSRSENWALYTGAGIGWVQEIDIDLEDGNIERSFSGDGDLGVQLMLGADFQLADNWTLNAELRYGLLSSVEMTGEENATGKVTGFDYNPVTLGVGIRYTF